MDTSSANKFYLELKGRTEANPHCPAEHEDCKDCIGGRPHLKIIKIWHLWLFFQLTVGVYVYLYGCDLKTCIRILCFSLIFTILGAVMFFRMLNRAVAEKDHEKLEMSRDLRLRMVETMTRINERQRKCLKICLFQAQTGLDTFLEVLSETKEDLRGSERFHDCLSGIVRLRDLREKLVCLRACAEAEKNAFSRELNNLQEATKTGKITEDQFTVRSGELYCAIKAMGKLVEKLQDIELDEPRRKDLEQVGTEQTEKAFLEFLASLETPQY